jgi:hypothetical protein
MWPAIEPWDRLRQLLSERAYYFALDGGTTAELFGKTGSLTNLVDALVAKKQADIASRGQEQEAELQHAIQTSAIRSRAALDASRAQDEVTARLDAQIADLDRHIRHVGEEEDRLPAGQRSARIVGKEAGAAAVATGLGDGATLILTISSTTGPLWLRLVIAVTIALVLNVAILAVARMVTGAWRMLSTASKLVRASVLAGAVGMLGLLLYGALETAGDFRAHALVNPEHVVATDLRFLVWVGLTAAWGAILALAWWHYASEGHRLARRRHALEVERGGVTKQRLDSVNTGNRLREKALEIVAEAQNAKSALAGVPDVVASLQAAHAAEGDVALGIARQRFAEGKRERSSSEKSKLKSPETIDPETEREIDNLIKEIFGE